MGVGVGSDAVTPEELIRRNVQARSPLEIRMLLQGKEGLIFLLLSYTLRKNIATCKIN